ncbi:MAG: hypothetical protein U0075_06085 [Thermomicrobiales bacterium]
MLVGGIVCAIEFGIGVPNMNHGRALGGTLLELGIEVVLPPPRRRE